MSLVILYTNLVFTSETEVDSEYDRVLCHILTSDLSGAIALVLMDHCTRGVRAHSGDVKSFCEMSESHHGSRVDCINISQDGSSF